VKYKEPTLFEIYVRIGFADNCITATKIFEIVPKLKDFGLDDVEMGQSFHQPVLSDSDPHVSPRTRVWDKEKMRLVQLSPNTVVINQTKKYLGWAKFKKLISDIVKVFGDCGVDPSLNSIELNTLDKFSVPESGFEMGKWLNCDGSVIAKYYTDCDIACDIVYGKGDFKKDDKNRQLRIAIRPSGDTVNGELQASFQNRATDFSMLPKLLDDLHEESCSLFESVITKNFRNAIMKGPAA